MSPKLATFFLLSLFLCFSLAYAARPLPATLQASPLETQPESVEAELAVAVDIDDCKGVGEDECLMRRTLAAHVDYIYTQKEKP